MSTESVTLETAHGDAGATSPSTPDAQEFTRNLLAEISAQMTQADAQASKADNPKPAVSGDESPPDADGEQTPPLQTPPEADAEGATEGTESRDKGQQWPASAVDRVRKLKEQRASLRDENERLKAELAKREAEQAPAKPAPDPAPSVLPHADDPLAHLNTPSEIEAEVARAEQTHELATDLLDDLLDRPEQVEATLKEYGVKMRDDDWSVTAMRDRLRQIRHTTERVMKAAPKRLKFLEHQDRSFQEALKVLPGLMDPKSQDFQDVAAVIREFPAIKQLPNWAYEAAVHAAGRRALAARSTPAATPRSAPPPTRLASQPGPAPRGPAPDDLAQAEADLGRPGAGRDAMLKYARAAVAKAAA